MVFVKKFFDDGAEGGGLGGGAPFNPFADAKKGEVTFGDATTVVEDENIVDDKPAEEVGAEVEVKTPEAEVKDIKPIEKKEDVVAEVAEPASEDKKPEVEVKVEAPVFNFDEELKKVDKYEVLKKLGYDEFEIGLLKYKAETGDVTPYLEAKTVDYTKFSDEQMMKYDLKNQHKGLSDRAFETLYKQEVLDKFILDAEIHGDAAAELGLELLKLKADKIRQSAIGEQAKFKAPEKQVDDSAQKQQQAYDAKITEYKEYVNESEETKALLKDKKLVFGTGETAFNYTVDNPTSLVDTILNPQSLFNDLVDAKGNVDQAKFYKIKAYALNPEKIEQMLINHGKTIGVKEYHEGLTNPSKKDAKAAVKVEPELTGAQALARFGKFKQN